MCSELEGKIRRRETRMPCYKCGSKNIETDGTSGLSVCCACAAIQSVDIYQDQYGGISGPSGTFVRYGTSGSGTNYTYQERKEFESSKTIEDVTYKLNFNEARTNEVKDMVRTVTDGQLGGGDWFPVLVGACSYVLMRQNNKPLPISEVAVVVSADVFELGKMVSRVVQRLELELPEFDILGMLERTMKDFFRPREIDDDQLRLMIKQGNFIIQCSIKWFLSTGRRPGPLVVAILVVVAELNGISVKISDVAMQLNVVVSTCKKRYNEVLDALVKVAQNLPWGKDVNAKNIMKNAHFVIQYMDMKSRENTDAERRRYDIEGGGLDLEHVVSQCLTKEVEYDINDGAIKSDSYFLHGGGHQDGDSTNNSNALVVSEISPETLAKLYEKFKADIYPLKSVDEMGRNHGRGRRSMMPELELYHGWWSGRSELCKKLFLQQILEKDVGLDAPPPSYTRGRLAVRRRREKIKAAKLRIDQVVSSQNRDLVDKSSYCLNVDPNNRGHSYKRKRRDDRDIDWEDFIIETLLLHQVEEQEIEKGHYKALLDLHVFNSGIAGGDGSDRMAA
ncbi:hypothetical protein Dimus_032664 [Dionaea muscipula]